MSSIAMVLARYGFTQYDPTTLNNTMLTYGSAGFQNGGVMWDAVDKITSNNVTFLKGYYGNFDKGLALQRSLMDDYLMKCMPVIVQVDHNGSPHWVLVTNKKDSDYSINDPSRAGNSANQKTLLSDYGDVYQMRIFKSIKGGCQ